MTTASAAPRGTPVISLRRVSKTYPGPPPVTAFKPSDLDIWPGEYLTVVGPSGSGKSTFLNIVGLIDRPTSGTYLLNGVDVGQLRERELAALRARSVGYVFQAFYLLPHRSAFENVMLAATYTGTAKAQRRRLAIDALVQVQLAHRMHEPPSRLSGGEQQRVAIARAIANRPALVLCDEPTGNLDTTTASTVLGLLKELHEHGHTIVVITHDLAVARQGQRTIELRDGTVAAVAPASETLT